MPGNFFRETEQMERVVGLLRLRDERADTRLDGLVARLRGQLDGHGLQAFEAVHQGWLAYRERYARFIAETYSGGSIQPLIHAVTLESITTAWITELETQLGDGDDGDEAAGFE